MVVGVAVAAVLAVVLVLVPVPVLVLGGGGGAAAAVVLSCQGWTLTKSGNAYSYVRNRIRYNTMQYNLI